MNNLNLHNIENIEFSTNELLGEKTTFVKNLRVTNTKGESFCISLFGKDLDNLEFKKESK
jgi:hypothetical protein